MYTEAVVFEGKFDTSTEELQKAIDRFQFDNFIEILGDSFGVELRDNKRLWYRLKPSGVEKWIFGYIELQQEKLTFPTPVNLRIVSCDPQVFYIWMELAQRLQSAFMPGGFGYEAPVPILQELAKGSTSSSAFQAKKEILRPEMILRKPGPEESLDSWLAYFHQRKNLSEINPIVGEYTLKKLAKDCCRSYDYVRHKHCGCPVCGKKKTQE